MVPRRTYNINSLQQSEKNFEHDLKEKTMIPLTQNSHSIAAGVLVMTL